MKLKIILLLILSLVLGCKESLNKNLSKNISLRKDSIRENSSKFYDSISGFYFSNKMKNCDFWITINRKENKYIYKFYNNKERIKEGVVKVEKEDENVYLIFENSFNSQYYRDTIIFQNYGNSMNEFEHVPFCELKYVTLIKGLNINKENIIFYNDKAYYLEQSKLYTESIYLLKKIIKNFPNRTVAYINIGDAYWNSQNKEKAKDAYKIYIEQMKEKGKEQKIPKRIFERIK